LILERKGIENKQKIFMKKNIKKRFKKKSKEKRKNNKFQNSKKKKLSRMVMIFC